MTTDPITTDAATHSIVRILRKLHQDTGSMVIRVECDWHFEEGVLLRRPKARLTQVRLVSAILPGDVTA